MFTLQEETRAGLGVLRGSADFTELEPSELLSVEGGVIAIPPVLVTALWMAGAIGAVAAVGIVVGVGLYVWTHRD